MTSLFFATDRGVVVRLNSAGDEITVDKRQAVEIEDLVGSRVRLENNGRELSCEALLSEGVSQAPERYRWRFTINESRTCGEVGTVEQLVSKRKVELNGRL